MKRLAEAIAGFPKSAADEVRFSTYSSDRFSYFSLHFFCIDGSGHSVVRVKIADVSTYANVRPVTNVAEFDLRVEAAAIDVFSPALSNVSMAGVGAVTAVLNGRA